MARFNPHTRPQQRGRDTGLRMTSLRERGVDLDAIRQELGVGDRRACAEAERRLGLRWDGGTHLDWEWAYPIGARSHAELIERLYEQGRGGDSRAYSEAQRQAAYFRSRWGAGHLAALSKKRPIRVEAAETD